MSAGSKKRPTYRSDSEGELTHRVESRRASVDELLNELGDLGTGGPFLGETLDLLLCRDLSSKEKPEESLRERLGSTWSGGKLSLALGDGESSESDTLVGVEDGAFPDEALGSDQFEGRGESMRVRAIASNAARTQQIDHRTHLDTPHTTVSLVDGHLAEALVSVGSSDGLDVLNLLGDELGHSVLEGLDVGSIGAGKGPAERGTNLGLVKSRTEHISQIRRAFFLLPPGVVWRTCADRMHGLW